MSAQREGMDIIWYLTGRWPNGRWRGRDLFHWRWWFWWNPRTLLKLRLREYIWHDTIGKRVARLILCPLFGHQNAQFVEQDRCYCFACQRDVK